ncbi:MAG: isocitrate lyase/phosphoenolpyruvate mutase family protein [Candidatus Eremiobacteraeota bacterium]|nr:isocitrate lyase/phosphoenolpyruvate mutase family protein [Candidatus Eremiobacteraeota bacterium]
MTQPELYEAFKALHARDGGFVMPNAWDGLSALVCKAAGFEALGTSSAAIAWSLGRHDGAHAVSREEHLANARLIGSVSGLPVNGDTEDGYGPSPDEVVATVEAAIAAGLAGVAIEDTTADPAQPIHRFDAAVERVKQAAKAAKGRIVLTARTDNFLQGVDDLDDTIKRLVAFAEVGADVLYAPYPPDMDAIRAIVRAVAPKPVNVVVGPGSGPVPVSELQAAGVKRISLGAVTYKHAIGALQTALTEAASGNLAPIASGIPTTTIMALIP